MTSNDEAAVEAIVAGMQPAHTMHGFAINILAAIRDGKVPGVRVDPSVGPDPRDQWHPGADGVQSVQELWAYYCERGDQSAELSALRAELAAVKGGLAKACDEIGDLQDLADSSAQDRDLAEKERDALAGLLEQSRGIIRRLVGYVADDGSPGNDAALDEAECFLAQSPDRIDAALGREGE